MSAGFLALNGFTHFPPLGSTAGLGGLNDELIPFPIDPLSGLQEGVGLDATLQASSPNAPKVAIFFPDHEGPTTYARAPVSATKSRPPGMTLSRPEKKKK
jgi:hypothetical protein